MMFLQELKEEGLVEVKWIPNEQMSSDLFTKNIGGEAFQQHTAVYCGSDDYN